MIYDCSDEDEIDEYHTNAQAGEYKRQNGDDMKLHPVSDQIHHLITLFRILGAFESHHQNLNFLF